MTFRAFRPGLLALSGLTAFGLASFVGADTAMYRGNSSLTGAFAEQLDLPLALEWKYTSSYFGRNPSSPAVVDGDVYFASGNRVYSVDAESGSLNWRWPVDQPLATAIHTSPVVHEGTVFIAAGDGRVYSIDAKTGKPGWQFNTASSIGSSPVLVGGVLYFGSSDGRVWAVNAKTGAMESSWKNGVKTMDEVASAPAVANNFVYAYSVDQQLYAIGTATGQVRWRMRVNGSVYGLSPVAYGDTLYAANGVYLLALMSRTGNGKWTRILPADIVVTPTVSDRGIFVTTSENKIYLLDHRGGRDKWKAPLQLDFDVVAPSIVAGDTLIVGTVLGGLFGIDADTGQLKWNYTIRPSTSSETLITPNTTVAAAPVVANKTLFVLTDDGTLNAFRSDALDSTGPEIKESEPEQGIVMNGEPPIRFEATIVDEGSGVNPESIKVMLDNQAMPRRPEGPGNEDKPGYVYDPVATTIKFRTIEPSSAGAVRPLPDGRHTVTVSASDWKGNTTAHTWSFTVDNTLAKVVRRPANQQTGAGPAGGPAGAGRGARSGGPSGSGGRPGGRPGGGPGGRPGSGGPGGRRGDG